MQNVSYDMFQINLEIAYICFLLLCLSGNGGCACVTERRQLHIFLRRVARSYYFVSTVTSTTLHLCASFFGSYTLWLAFNTAVAFILVFVCGDAEWHMTQHLKSL